MSYGEIYKTTWWGNPTPEGWGNSYFDKYFKPSQITGLKLWSYAEVEPRPSWNVTGFQLNNEADATTNLKSKTGGYYVSSLATGDSISIPEITLTGDFSYHAFLEVSTSALAYGLLGNSANDEQGIFINTLNQVSVRIGSTYYAATSSTMSNGFHLVQLVRNGSNMLVYVDGVYIETLTVSTNDVVLNGVGIYNSLYFSTTIKDLALFNTALTASQISNLYNNPQRFVELSREYGAERIYPFMEGNGEVGYSVWDLSGNDQHGTIQSNLAPAGTNFIYNDAEVGSQQVLESRNYTQNKFPYSADFENAAWAKLRGTLTSGQSDPDGGTDAFKFQQDALETQTPVIRQAHNSVIDKVYTIRVKAKKGTNRDYIQIAELVLDGTTNVTTFDLNTGVVLYANPDHIASITDLGNGWYDCKISFTCTASQTVRPISFRPAVDTSSTVPDDQGFVYFYQPQFYESTEDVLFYETGATGINNWLFIPESSTKGIDLFGNTITNQWKQGLLNFTGLDLVDNTHSGVEFGDQVDTLDVSDGRVIAFAFKYKNTGNNQFIIANRSANDGFGIFIDQYSNKLENASEEGGVQVNVEADINLSDETIMFVVVFLSVTGNLDVWGDQIDNNITAKVIDGLSVGYGQGTEIPIIGISASGILPFASFMASPICLDKSSITLTEINNLRKYLKSIIS